MKQEKKLQMLAKLRKEDPKIVKHMGSTEDFSSLTSDRDAFRKARMAGRLNYIWNPQGDDPEPRTTRLESETEHSYLQHIIDRAKQNTKQEVGAQDPLAMMEGKIRPAALKKIILEEINLVLEDCLSCTEKNA
jgi:hypothetical protein